MQDPPHPTIEGASPRPEGLVALVGPTRAEHYAQHSWWEDPFVASGPVERFPISAALASSPYPDLIRSFDGQRRTWHSGQDGEQQIFAVDDGDLAASLLDTGSAITLEFIDRTSHFDQQWGLQVIEDLGYPAIAKMLAVTCFISPAGTGAHKHVDASPFFILQVRGRKRWWVAENRDAPHPLEGWGPSWVTPVPPEFRPRVDRISTQMPEGSQQFVLEPGDVLYVPGGHWHETHSEQDSLSLSFIPRVPSWVQMVIDALIERLRAQPSWREPAIGLNPAMPKDLDPRAHVELLLASLTEEIRGIEPRALLCCAALQAEKPELTSASIVQPRFHSAGATVSASSEGLLVVTPQAEIVVEPGWAELCRWATTTTAPFSLVDAWEHAAGALRGRELIHVLETLVEVGALADSPG